MKKNSGHFGYFWLAILIVVIFHGFKVQAETKTSNVSSGVWSNPSIWSPAGVPVDGDDVIIASGTNINIDVNTANLASLTITGALTVGNDFIDRTITLTGDMTITGTGFFETNGNGGNLLYLGGNMTNQGYFSSLEGSASMNVIFNGFHNQSVSGNGSYTWFNQITINNSGNENDNIVEFSIEDFNVPNGFLTLTDGIVKFSGNKSIINTFFPVASYSIPAGTGIWLNNSSVTVYGQNGSPSLYGLIRITAGTFNIGTSAGNSLKYYSGSSFIMEGGAMNIAGRFYPNSSTQTISFNMSDGILTIADVGYSSGTAAGFDISTSGSSFTMSGGTIIIENPNGNTTTPCDYRNVAGTANITGGTIQFATDVSSGAPNFVVGVSPTTNVLPNLTLVKAATSTTVTFNAPVNVKGDVTITTGTTLNANGQAMEVTGNSVTYPGNWTNNGATFTSGNGTVYFNGTNSQEIKGSVINQVFNNIIIAKPDGKILSVGGSTSSIEVRNYTQSSGNFTPPATMVIKGNASVSSGTFTSGLGNVVFNGNANQSVSGNLDFYNLTIQNTGSSGNNYVSFLNYNNIRIQNLYLLSGLLNYGGVYDFAIKPNGTITSNGGNFSTYITNDYMTFLGATTITTITPLDFYKSVRLFGPTDFGTNSTIHWFLTMITGSSIVNNPPYYSTGSYLRYCFNGLTFNRGLEWSSTSGKGYPYNIEFPCSPGTILKMGTIPAQCGGYLYINSSNTVDMETNTNALTVLGNFTIENGGILKLSTNAGGDIKVGGNWTNAGTFIAYNGAVHFIGSGTQTIMRTGGETIPLLIINKPSGTVSLPNNLTISNNLTFTASNNGTITTNSYSLIISNSTSNAIDMQGSNGFVIGNLQRAIAAGVNNYIYPIGSLSAYTPVSFSFLTGTEEGYLTGFTVNSDHSNIGTSNISPLASINRNWTFTINSGLETVNYNATFNWINSDQDPGFNYAAAICGKYMEGSWSYPAISELTSTSAQIAGVTGFSDFQIGNSNCIEPDVPTVSANPSTICVGNSSSLSITGGNLNDATDWYWYSGSCGGTLEGTGTSLVVYPSSTTTYYVRGEGGCSTPDACAQVTVTVNPTALVDGYFKYYNNASTALNNVSIELQESGVYKYGTSTNSSGYFSFSAVCPGTYDVVASKSTIIGGINSTDAAQVNYWSVNNSFIEKVRYLAGEVTGDFSVLSGDAGLIQQYFITQGNPNPAFVSNWSFWKTGELINGNQGPLGYPTITITAGATSLSQNFYGLVTGDFNRSYVPGSFKSGSESLVLTYGDFIEAGLNSEFELPLYAAGEMEVGAVSLILEFPSDLMEINGVFLSNDPDNSVPYLVSGDEIRIGWNSLTPLLLQEGEPMVTLLLKVNEPSGEEGIKFKLADDPLNELADGSFEVISDAVLRVNIIKTTATGLEDNTLSEKLTLSNHPNPFMGTTTFAYSFPVDGKVTLEIYDIVGNKIKVLVDETQSADNYQVKMEQNELQPGVYTATLKLENSNIIITRTIKIISKK